MPIHLHCSKGKWKTRGKGRGSPNLLTLWHVAMQGDVIGDHVCGQVWVVS